MKKYYAMQKQEKTADIYIYGDITSWECFDSDVSSYTLSREIENLSEDVETVNVYINSYGGEVAEGLAIYNTLKRCKAKVKTYCDGFACSIASVIFMAGEERIMSNASLLMIHNAWMYTAGNASQLRKDADDLEVISQASKAAYLAEISITEEELQELLNNESWISPERALEIGFATTIISVQQPAKASQSAQKTIIEKLLLQEKQQKKEPEQKAKKEVAEEAKEETEETEETEEKENKTQKLLSALFR